MLKERRVAIAPLAKQFRAEGFRSGKFDPLDRAVEPRSKEAYQLYNDIKPELYTLLSEFADRIVAKAYAARINRRPFGLIKNGETVTELADFRDLALRMTDTLSLSLLEETKNFPPQSWQRTQKITEKLNESLPDTESRTPEERLNAGINTAVGTIAALLAVAYRLSPDKTIENLVQVAKNSYPLITRLAMENIDVLAESNFMYIPFNFTGIDFFTLETKRGKTRISLSEKGDAKQNERRARMERILSKRGIELLTAGCPAMVNFDGSSAVRKLWDWNLEIAPHVYSQLNLKKV